MSGHTIQRLPPIHPGEVRREEFLRPMNLPAHQLALALRAPATRVNEIVNQRRGIAAGTAMRLARNFGTTAKSWINLQAACDLDLAEDRFREAVDCEVLPRSA